MQQLTKEDYKHITDNVIKILQKWEMDEDRTYHSTEEWITLLNKELKEEENQ